MNKRDIIERQNSEITDLKNHINEQAIQACDQMLHNAFTKVKSERIRENARRAEVARHQEIESEKNIENMDGHNNDLLNNEFNRIMEQYGLELCTNEERVQLNEGIQRDSSQIGNKTIESFTEKSKVNLKESDRSISNPHQETQNMFINEFQMKSSKQFDKNKEAKLDKASLRNNTKKNLQTVGLELNAAEYDKKDLLLSVLKINETKNEIKRKDELLFQLKNELQNIKISSESEKLSWENLNIKNKDALNQIQESFGNFRDNLNKTVQKLVKNLKEPGVHVESSLNPAFFSSFDYFLSLLKFSRQTNNEGSQTLDARVQKYSLAVQTENGCELVLSRLDKKINQENKNSNEICQNCVDYLNLKNLLKEKENCLETLTKKHEKLFEKNNNLEKENQLNLNKFKKYKDLNKNLREEIELVKTTVNLNIKTKLEQSFSKNKNDLEEKIKKLLLEIENLGKENVELRTKNEKIIIGLKNKRKMMLKELNDFAKSKNDFDNSFLTEYSVTNLIGNQ